MSDLKVLGRILFWPIFLAAIGMTAYYFWQKQPPQQFKYQFGRLAHPNAKIAGDAWQKISNLFFTDWAVFYSVLDETNNNAPISFLIEKSAQLNSDGTKRDIFVATKKPIFYKTEQVYCRTIGEALMAMAYNDPKVDEKFYGDWQTWWRKNRSKLGS